MESVAGDGDPLGSISGHPDLTILDASEDYILVLRRDELEVELVQVLPASWPAR